MAIRRKRTRTPYNDPKSQFRINEQIGIPEIRLVGDNLEEISEVANRTIGPGVYNTKDALSWAFDLGLDLVEISPKAHPPVCKIIDYNKFLYLKKKKEKEIKSNTQKTVIKEIRFGPNTDDHDFQFKLRHAIKFLEEGSKVKAYVHFRGRSIVYKDRGELLLLKLMKELEELGSAEELPRLEKRRMTVMIAPKKQSKQGSKKKKSE